MVYRHRWKGVHCSASGEGGLAGVWVSTMFAVLCVAAASEVAVAGLRVDRPMLQTGNITG